MQEFSKDVGFHLEDRKQCIEMMSHTQGIIWPTTSSGE